MPQNIQHVVVLMLENRAFDHMLGFMKASNPAIDGLTGTESNPSNPLTPIDDVTVSQSAPFVLTPDPGHSVADTNVQLFASLNGPPPVGPPNKGFIWSYSQQKPAPVDAKRIMECFDPANVPVLSTLSRQFALCDAWYSSVPGPTWPNRFFAHAATSKGFITNSQFNNYDMPTIFESLSARGLTWRNYYHDFSQTWALQRLGTDENRINFRSFGQFKKDAKKGQLPNYAFIEPKYFSFFGEANDQHPPHDVRAGERLIAQVYQALLKSPQWNDTMLLVTYDEHGGTYDHALPPPAVPPDGHTSQFSFDRYGLRVPAIIISPFVPASTVVHDVFDHTSIPATLATVFQLPGFLTARDAQANTFSHVASLGSPRTDLPDLEAATGRDQVVARASARGAVVVRDTLQDAEDGSSELSEFQEDLIELARSLEKRHAPLRAQAQAVRRPRTEHEGAIYVRSVAAQLAVTRPASGATQKSAGSIVQGRAASRPREAGYVHRIVVPPHTDVCLPFAHAMVGEPVQIRFAVVDGEERLQRTARYIATVDEPYGSGDLDDASQGAFPPVIFNDTDDDVYVDVSASVGAPAFAVSLECEVESADHQVTMLFFCIDGRPLLTAFARG